MMHDISALEIANVLQAYACGIFPMAKSSDDSEIHWIRPRERCVMPLDERFHVSRSLNKALRRNDYLLCQNRNFAETLNACVGVHDLTSARTESWINRDIARLYLALHHAGYAHSFEVYDRKSRLIGGLYGLALGGAFFGESMFSRRRDASKIALVGLVEHLRKQDYQLLDCQFPTTHLEHFGAYVISDTHYQQLLQRALQQSCTF